MTSLALVSDSLSPPSGSNKVWHSGFSICCIFHHLVWFLPPFILFCFSIPAPKFQTLLGKYKCTTTDMLDPQCYISHSFTELQLLSTHIPAFIVFETPVLYSSCGRNTHWMSKSPSIPSLPQQVSLKFNKTLTLKVIKHILQF